MWRGRGRAHLGRCVDGLHGELRLGDLARPGGFEREGRDSGREVRILDFEAWVRLMRRGSWSAVGDYPCRMCDVGTAMAELVVMGRGTGLTCGVRV